MKKALISILAIIIAFSFVACGGETNNSNNESQSSTQETTPVSQTTETKTIKLDEYYSSNFDKDSSGRIIKDIDSDGVDDMIVCEIKCIDEKIITDCNIYYFGVENGEVMQYDKFTVNNTYCDDYYAFYGEDTLFFAENGGQLVEVYQGENGYICCKIAICYESWAAHYILLKAENKKISEVQHLLDPGFTSGVGLYYYNGYSDDYESVELFSEDEMGKKEGKYSSYKEALDAEIGKYGFGWKKSNDNCSALTYDVDLTDGVEVIYKTEMY
ncbi:MAG: hypothetical protein ACI4XH_03950 [Acutalibacteraceae bacterium]